MSDSNPQKPDANVLDLIETGVQAVEELEATAKEANARADKAEARVGELEAEIATLRSQVKAASAKPSIAFSSERLESLCELLNHAGLTKQSSDQLQKSLQDKPDTAIDMIENLLNADSSDAGELTSRKQASETSIDLWQQAAAE
jgi:uncharacterized protein (DUF342 family)